MRLYPRAGQTAIDDPEHGHFDAGPDGGFDLPEPLGERLRRFHVDRAPMWETDIERQSRLISEELERRKDPATLLEAVEQIMRAAQASAGAQAVAATQAPAAKARVTKKAAPPASTE